MSKANCRIFVSLFGPPSDLHVKCKDVIDHGFFHGEQTSQESDECFNKTGRKHGSYLIRLRKGAKHQMALAFVDDSGNTKHMLISIGKNGFALHANGTSLPVKKKKIQRAALLMLRALFHLFTAPFWDDWSVPVKVCLSSKVQHHGDLRSKRVCTVT